MPRQARKNSESCHLIYHAPGNQPAAVFLQIWPMDEFIELNETAVKTNCLDIAQNVTIRLTDEKASALM